MQPTHGVDGWTLLNYEWYALEGIGRFRYAHTSGKVVDTVRSQTKHRSQPRLETR